MKRVRLVVLLVCVFGAGLTAGRWVQPRPTKPRPETHWKDVTHVVILEQPATQPGAFVTHTAPVCTWRLGSELVVTPDNHPGGHLTVLLRFGSGDQLMLVTPK